MILSYCHETTNIAGLSIFDIYHYLSCLFRHIDFAILFRVEIFIKRISKTKDSLGLRLFDFACLVTNIIVLGFESRRPSHSSSVQKCDEILGGG